MLKTVRHVAAEGRPQPDRYISPEETTTEDPGTLRDLEWMRVEIGAFCAGHQLPVSVRVTTPSLATQFVISRLPVAGLTSFSSSVSREIWHFDQEDPYASTACALVECEKVTGPQSLAVSALCTRSPPDFARKGRHPLC